MRYCYSVIKYKYAIKMALRVEILLLFLCLLVTTLASKMEIPSFATEGDRVVMECNIEKRYPIEQIRWYKDNVSFYSVAPSGDKPPEVGGLIINIKDSKPSKILIDSATVEHSGIYICEAQMADDVVRMCGTLSVRPYVPVITSATITS